MAAKHIAQELVPLLEGAEYCLVERAVHSLYSQQLAPPDLGSLAAELGVSASALQKTFSRWVGVSPKRFQQYLSKEYAKRRLQAKRSVLDASYDTGLSGGGRLHDLMVVCEAVTPGELKAQGQGLVIRYGVHPSPFGTMFVALTERGICQLHFVDTPGQHTLALDQLQRNWPRAALLQDSDAVAVIVAQMFSRYRSGQLQPLHLLLKGSNFQLQVWQALLEVPLGDLVSYADIARAVGRPGAARAAGSALAANQIGWLIPCHRVIRGLGDPGQYRWGLMRKRVMLGWEGVQCFEGSDSD